MSDYCFTALGASEIESIRTLLTFMCKENNINQERQKYKVLFNNEQVLTQHNGLMFTSGSKKYMSFYGKIYLNKNINMVETIVTGGDNVIIEPYANSILMISGGVNNSTTVQNDQDVLYFYIAPEYLLELQDSQKWENL